MRIIISIIIRVKVIIIEKTFTGSNKVFLWVRHDERSAGKEQIRHLTLVDYLCPLIFKANVPCMKLSVSQHKIPAFFPPHRHLSEHSFHHPYPSLLISIHHWRRYGVFSGWETDLWKESRYVSIIFLMHAFQGSLGLKIVMFSSNKWQTPISICDL